MFIFLILIFALNQRELLEMMEVKGNEDQLDQRYGR